MIFAGTQAVAADGADLVERWRDLGPVMWAVAAGAAAAWFGLLAMAGAWLDPRRVAAGAATLDPPGDEPPAVVNLLTTDWDLGPEAVPATLVDLAARRHLEVDLVGGETHVRLRRHRAGAADHLTDYEQMVLAHVRGLAAQTSDGRVPAAAMSTGPEQTSKTWWETFRKAVVADARGRGLSRARWSRGLKVLLAGLAVPVALAVAVAVSTLPDDPDDSDDDPLAAALWMGVVGFGALSVVVARLDGERDTPAGRATAAGWLGMRELLGEDPLFGEQPPAAVAIWDRILAHGTALGAARGVVRALPLGTENDRQAWSSVGGQWRVVRVRYPRAIPPGYGRHPALALLLGLVHLAIGLPLVPVARGAASAVREAVASGQAAEALGQDVPAGYSIGVTVVVAVVAVVSAGVGIRGAALTLAGLGDLVTGRTVVEGRAVRVRDRSTDDHVRIYVAVDDGTNATVRAWLLRSRVGVAQGAIVRAQVTRWLRHAAEIEVVRPAATAAPAAAGAVAPTAAAAAEAGAPIRPRAAGAPATGGAVPRIVSVMSALVAAATADGAARPEADLGDGAAGGAPGPPPPPAPALPDDAAVAAAVGCPLVRDPHASPHPASLPGGSALCRSPGADRVVQLAWVPAVAIGVYRALPAASRRTIPGLGDEAYHARAAGALMARRGDDVLMATVHAPDLAPDARDALVAGVAAEALASAVGPDPGPGPRPRPDAGDTWPPPPAGAGAGTRGDK